MTPEERAVRSVARDRASLRALQAELEVERAAAALARAAADQREGELWAAHERLDTRSSYERWAAAMDGECMAVADEQRLSEQARRLRVRLEQLDRPYELQRRVEDFERLDELHAREREQKATEAHA